MDATHITADIATQGLVNLLRQGRKMVVKKIEKATNKRPKELEERYITKEKIYKKPTNEEREKEINLTKEFINQIEGKYLEVEEITDLLKEVVSQKESEELKNKDISTPPSQSETDQALTEKERDYPARRKRGRPRKVNTADRPPKPNPQNPSDSKHLTNQATRNNLTKRKDQISSFVGSDARFGHKSKKKTFCGYKAHAAMDESGIVTSVQTFGGNENESTKLKELLQEEKEKQMWLGQLRSFNLGIGLLVKNWPSVF